MFRKSLYEIRDDEHGVGKILIPKGNWTEQCSTRIDAGDVQGVRLSYSCGFRDPDIGFLALFPSLRSVEIYSAEVKKLQPLDALGRLEVLGLQTGSDTKLSATSFPQLRVALIQWRRGMEGLLDANQLEYLNCLNYPFTNLLALLRFEKLNHLSLTSRKLESIEDIFRFPMLKILDFYNCPNLLSIEPALQCKNIKEIAIQSCRNIPNQK